MKARIMRASFVLAAWMTALATAMSLCPSVAEAGRFYFRSPPVTSGNPEITTAVVIVFALAIGIEVALVVYFILRGRRRTRSTRVEAPRTTDVRDQMRRAA